MNKQNRKIKKGILLATVAAVIGIGFWVGKTAEPLKAADKEETKNKVEKADESFPLENNNNYTLYPDFTSLTMEPGDDYGFPEGWAMGIGNADFYTFKSINNPPITNKYQLLKGQTPKVDAKDINPSKVYWQLDPTGGAVFAATHGTLLNNKIYKLGLIQEFTLKRDGGSKLFYYINGSQATLPGSNIANNPENLPTEIAMRIAPGGLKSQSPNPQPIDRYNFRMNSSFGEDESGKDVQLSVSNYLGGILLDGKDKFGSLTLSVGDLDAFEKYVNNKARFLIQASNTNSYKPINAVKLNYAQMLQAALIVEKPLKIELPVGSDVAYLQDKNYFKSLIPRDEIMVFTDETGEKGKPLSEYGEDVDFSVDEVQIDNTYTDTVTNEGGRTSIARISAVIEGKKLQGVVPFNLNVVWGNTIALGTETSGADESAVAFSLVKSGEQYEVVQNFGNGWNAKNFPMDKTKVTVDYFKQSGSGTILNIDDQTKPDTSATLSGTDIPTQKSNIWGTNGRQKVSIGDVIRVQSNEPAKEWLYKDSQKILTVDDFYQPEVVYYSITADGFQPLYLNQVKGKTNITAYHKETNVQITADFKTHKDNYIETMPTGTYTGVSWDGEFKTANNPDTSIANRKNVPGTLTLSATMAIGTYTLMVSDFTITPTFDIGAEGVEPPEPEEKWELVLNSNILKEFDVGEAEPRNTTIKDWFYGQVNFRNVNTGELLYSGGGGLPRDNFSVDLVTNWDSKTAGTFPYAVKITVTSEPSSVAGKLVSNTMTTSGNQLQIKFNQTTTNGGEIIVYYYLDEDHYQGTMTVPGGTIGSTATIPKPSYNNDYDFDRAEINSPANTVYSWPENIKFTAEQQKVWIYYTTKPTEPEKGGKIQVNYYLDSVDNASIGQKTVPGGDVGTYATIPQFEGYTAADLKEAILPDGTKLTTWPTDKIKFTTADQMVWIVYNSKQVDDVTVKVTMVDEAGNPISFPAGTTKPLTLYDSSTVFATDSSVSGSTVSFASKIKKGDFYRIGQNTAIDGYLKYDQDPKAGENQTPKIGVSTDNKAEFSGHEKPPTEENGWIVYLGVSLKYDASSSTLNVKITNKTATVYQLSVDTQTIDLWAGDPIRTSAELKEIFRGHIKVVEDKTPVSPGIELSDSQYSLEITSNWVNTVTPVGSPRSFTVKVTPTQAAINEYPGLATLSGEYLKVNFKEITYELQATGVPHEYWSNDPQPNADERLTWVEDVKILPSNTPDNTTATTATKVEITGYKEGGSAKPTTEVDMTKLGETIYLVTVTAKNPLNKDTEITRENVEVPITIVKPPTYELKINVVDTDGKPINYEDVSAPFGYTLDGKDNWDTTATTAENVITFTNKLDIQSKYQIEQSDVLQPNTEETSEELPNDTSVVFPPESGIKPPGLTQELHTKTLTETYPWNEQKASLAFVISRDESTLSYGSKTYDTDTENPIELADGLKAKYNKDERILELTVTNDQGELSLAVPDLIFQQGTPGIMKEQLLERKENAKDPWKVKIKDTLQTNQMWSLEAKLTEPFTLTGENREIKDILVYKETPTSAQQLMVLDQAMPILDKTSAGAPNTEQFYEKTWEKQAGFLLSVDKQKSMGIKGGVYTAALEFTLKDAD